MKLTLDLPENLGNARLHWAAKHKAKRRYWEAQDRRQLLGLVEPPPSRPMPAVRVLAHLRLWNPADPDGCAARLKWALDWLVTRGYLLDDGPKVVRELVVTQEINRANTGLDVTLEPVA